MFQRVKLTSINKVTRYLKVLKVLENIRKSIK